MQPTDAETGTRTGLLRESRADFRSCLVYRTSHQRRYRAHLFVSRHENDGLRIARVHEKPAKHHHRTGAARGCLVGLHLGGRRSPLPDPQVDEVCDTEPLDQGKGHGRTGENCTDPRRDNSDLQQQSQLQPEDVPVSASQAVGKSRRHRRNGAGPRRQADHPTCSEERQPDVPTHVESPLIGKYSRQRARTGSEKCRRTVLLTARDSAMIGR